MKMSDRGKARWALWAAASLLAAEAARGGRECLLVRGALGDARFGEEFAETEAAWREAAERAGDVRFRRVTAKDSLAGMLRALAPESTEELWLVLVGHGTYDGRSAKFNLEGEDVSAEELQTWLKSWTKPLVIIHGGAASAPFIPVLSGKDRILITATQSGSEVYAPRFGGELARVLRTPEGETEADLDQDGAVSVLEAAVVAANRVAAHYETANQLAAEHALLDDNGDGKGTRLDWFEGLKLKRKLEEGRRADGGWAGRTALVRSRADRGLAEEQRRRRDELERELGELKEKRGGLGEEEFFRKAEAILLELGRLGEAAGVGERGSAAEGGG